MAKTRELPMRTVKVLLACKELELQAARLYHHFASCFKEDQQLVLFWRKIALEEENHAQQFHLAIRLKVDLIEELVIDDIEAFTALHQVTRVLESVKKTPPSLEKALLMAIDLEEQFTAFHMDSVGSLKSEEYNALFRSMMDADDNHVKQLWEKYDELIAEQKGKTVDVTLRK